MTGNFDNWTVKNDPLTATEEANGYSKQIKFEKREKIVFKFVVDGDWRVSSNYKIEKDAAGIENNYIDADELVELQEFEVDDTPAAAPVAAVDPELKEEVEPAQFHTVSVPDAISKAASAEPSDLSNVSTRGSSFAAVLIPSGNDHSDSAFEQIDETPTTSVINSRIINPVAEEKDNSTITSVSNSSIEPTDSRAKAKKENLLTKFKGLFRY